MVKVIVDQKTDRYAFTAHSFLLSPYTQAMFSVLGCHMVGEDAPEIMQGLAIAIKCQGNEG